ncbi:MAG: hypothetical protein AAFO77_02290 [Pseudomonadota bacterium]
MLKLKVASLFIWVIGAIALFGLFMKAGLPHVIFGYTFLENGDRYNPFAPRYYTSCEFVGPYGGFKRPAQNGKCPWVRMFRDSSQ